MKASRFLSLMAMGDAFGMNFEFVERFKNIEKKDLTYGAHPKFTEYKIGHYTDDTQMALANMELLLQHKKNLQALTQKDFIDIWLKAFKRDERVGYSKHMYKVLQAVDNDVDFMNMLDPKMGTTSGAAMRAGVFGLLNDIDEVKHLTILQGKVTHDTSAGIHSALAISLSVHYLHHGGVRETLPLFLKMQIGDDWASTAKGYSDDPNNGLKIVSQALNALQDVKTYSDVLLKAVNQDMISDTDTVCALAMLLASKCSDLKDDLPRHLYQDLENNTYGRDFLMKLDAEAMKTFPSSKCYRVKSEKNQQPPNPQIKRLPNISW